MLSSSIGWLVAAGIVLWLVAAQRSSHRKRRHLRSYVIFLLMNDRIREDHKDKFEKWIRHSAASDATQLGWRACQVIENMADSLAEHDSLVEAQCMLWNCDAALELRKNYVSLEDEVTQS